MISLIGETKKNSAFTLIEILLVIVIMGIVLAIAAPNFSNGYSNVQLKKTADDLLTVSRWAQAMAIGQERTYALSFSNDRHSYNLIRTKDSLQNEEVVTNDGTDDADNYEPVHGALGKMHTVPGAIRLDTKDDLIKFYPDGTIDQSKIQLVTPKQKIVLSSSEVRGMMTKVDSE